MTSRATLGDFLQMARSQLALPEQGASATPGRDLEEFTGALQRFVRSLSRYTSDATKAVGRLPDEQTARLSTWERAGLQAHDAADAAMYALAGDGRSSLRHAGNVSHQGARALSAAALAITAGHDLLEGHFATGPSGERLRRSGWAPVISSPAVSRASLVESAALARRAVLLSATTLTADTAGPNLTDARTRLNVACHWLGQLSDVVHDANRREPVPATSRELLRAIPANVMPSAHAEDITKAVPDICEAVVSAAERARYAAWHAAAMSYDSPSISVTSWHRIAAASTVTSHHCFVLWSTLADASAQRRNGKVDPRLHRVTALAESAREHWLDASREYESVTTEVRGHISPAAAEAADLAVWTGRLAYVNPEWTLASGPNQTARPAHELAPRPADMAGVIAALHQTSEALCGLATANLEQARTAVRAQRLLVPLRSLPERFDVPHPFTRAPAPYSASLVACCQDTLRCAAESAEATADIATSVAAPSRSLATARDVLRDERRSRGRQADIGIWSQKSPDPPSAAGPVESELRELGVSNPRLLWRACALDHAGEQVIDEGKVTLAEVRRRQADLSHVAAAGRPGDIAGGRSAHLGARPRDEPEAEP